MCIIRPPCLLVLSREPWHWYVNIFSAPLKLRPYGAIQICLLLLFFWIATAIYSVTMVLWKETAFPLCRAMERRWKRNVVSRVSYSRTGHHSGDTPANLLFELNGHLMPCTNCSYGKWVEDVCAAKLFFIIFLMKERRVRYQRYQFCHEKATKSKRSITDMRP